MEIVNRLNNISGDASWDYVGNAIINPLIEDSEFDDYIQIVDAIEEGSILEAEHPQEDAISRYLSYYFMPNSCKDFSKEMERCKCGIISLHNSWTPDAFKKLTEKEINNMKNNYLLPYTLMKANS
jgi:hypothetical protein